MIDSDLYGKLENLIEEYISRDIKDHIRSAVDERIEGYVRSGAIEKEDAQKVSGLIHDHYIEERTTKEDIYCMATSIAEEVATEIHDQVIHNIETLIEELVDEAHESIITKEDHHG